MTRPCRTPTRMLLAAVLLFAAGAVLAQPASPPAAPPKAESPAVQPIPFRKDDDTGALALNVATGLVVSIGLAVGVLFVLRRYLQKSQQAPGKRLRVLETVRLTPKSALYLVEVDKRTLLIGQQGETLAVLAQSMPGENATTVPHDAAPPA